jgi:hypothetical protein
MSNEMMRVLTRLLAAGIGVLAVGISVPASGVEAKHQTDTTCTNPVSGTNWQIKIDYEGKTVDSNPAYFTDAKISWRDAKDGANYTLDRKSGNLTVVFASSTGGSFLYHRCRLEN